MKIRTTVLSVSVAIGVGLTLWCVAMLSPAEASPIVATSALVMTSPALGEEGKYVGSNKCKMCHIKQHKSWKKTKMANALDILKPGNSAELKKAHGLDPAKDYSTDQACLACHVTGFGKEGGYAIPDLADKKAVRRAKKLAGVGCESCHGPGSGYIELHGELLKSKRSYRVEEMYAAGMWKIENSTCITCHNEQSPTRNPDVPFVFATMKDQGTHEHLPLKQREK